MRIDGRLVSLACSVALWVMVGCSAVVNPDPTRLGHHDDVGQGLDAFSVVDAFSPLDAAPSEIDAEIDAHIEAPPDAFSERPCSPGCTDGLVCVEGSCVCPAGACCPACGPGQLCRSGSCVACGGAGETCCDGDARCGDDLTCLGGLCAACGAPSEPCCDGVCTTGARCESTGCVADCGFVGLACCDRGACHEGVCDSGPFASNACQPCGLTDQRCCPERRCEGDNVCSVLSRCDACGGRYQPCCSGGMCRDGRCTGGRCI